MPKYIGIAMANPVEGKEQEFNEWYDNQHILDVLSIPGNVSAQRYRVADSQLPNRSSPYRYLAVYEVDVDDLQSLIAATVERGGTSAMPRSDAVAWDNVFTVFFEPIGPKKEKKR